MPLRSKTFHELEKGYDNNLTLINVSRKISTSSKQFGFTINEKSKSPFLSISELKPSPYENSYYRDDCDYTAKSRPNFDLLRPQSAFSSITAALGFKHHQGTDQEKELGVLKIIISRESLILKLKSLCYKISQCNILVKSSTNLESELLDVLALMRTMATNYIEHLLVWRESTIDYQPHNPKAFTWEGQNYTLKLTHDLDFLADQSMLVESLQLSEDKMIGNPLMLPNNLEEAAKLIMDPLELASYDSEGQREGTFFEQRLRIRKAERVLLQELESSSFQDNQEIHGDIDSFENSNIILPRNNSVEVNEKEQSEVEILTWKINALMQLKNIESLRGETLRSSSTGRLSDLKTVSVPNSPKVAHPNVWLAEPTKLNVLFERSSSGRQIGPETASSSSTRPSSSGSHLRPPSSGGQMRPSSSSRQSKSEPLLSSASGQQIQIKQLSFNESSLTEISEIGVSPFDDIFETSRYPHQNHGNGMVRDNNLNGSQIGNMFVSVEENASDHIISTSEYSPYSIHEIENTVCSITAYELQRIETLDFFPPRLVLASAAIVILMSSVNKGEDIPQDVSLAAFKSLAKAPGLLSSTMNQLDVSSIDRIKIKALAPYISVLNRHDDFSGSNLSTNEIFIANKLCKWVVQVVSFAVTSEFNAVKVEKNNSTKRLPSKTASDIDALPTFSKRIQNFKKDVKNISAKQKNDLIKSKDTDQLRHNVASKSKKRSKAKYSEIVSYPSTSPGRDPSLMSSSLQIDSTVSFCDSSLVQDKSLIDRQSLSLTLPTKICSQSSEGTINSKPETSQAPISNRAVQSALIREKKQQISTSNEKESEFISTRMDGRWRKVGTTSSAQSSTRSSAPSTSNPKAPRLASSAPPMNSKQLREKNLTFETIDIDKKIKDPVHKFLATDVVPMDDLLKSSTILSGRDQGGCLEDESIHNELRVDGIEYGESKSAEEVTVGTNNTAESYQSGEPEIHKDDNSNNVGQQKKLSNKIEEKQNEEGDDDEEYAEDVLFSSISTISDKDKGGSLENESVYDELKVEINHIDELENGELKAVERVTTESKDEVKSFRSDEPEINSNNNRNNENKFVDPLSTQIHDVKNDVEYDGDYVDDEDFEGEGEISVEKIKDNNLLTGSVRIEKQNLKNIEVEVDYVDEDFEGEEETIFEKNVDTSLIESIFSGLEDEILSVEN